MTRCGFFDKVYSVLATIFGWNVTAIVVPVVVGAAFLVALESPSSGFAKPLFMVAAAWTFGSLLLWLGPMREGILQRFVWPAFLFAVVGVGLLESLRFVDRVEINKKGEDVKTVPPAPVVVVQPGGVASVGQQGGITAGQILVNAPPMVVASDQTQERTGDMRAPWTTVFRIKSTGLVVTGDLRLKCSGPVIRAGIGRINPVSFVSGSNGPDPSDPTVVVYELGPEPLPGGREVVVAVYSMNPVRVLTGTIGSEQIHFPG